MKRGRPVKPESQRRSKNFTFRSRGDMQSKLQDAAQRSGRSVSEEIEHRLDRSFDHVFDPRHENIFRLLAGAIALAEEREGKRWNEDLRTALAVFNAMRHAIELLVKESFTPEELDALRVSRVAHALANPPPGQSIGEDKS